MISALLTHLYESTLFGLVACALILLFRKGSSWSRHFIAWVALIKFLVPLSWFEGWLPYSIEWSSILSSDPAPTAEVLPPLPLDTVAIDLTAAGTAPAIPWATLLLITWLSGFLILFTRRSLQYLRCKRSIANTSRPAHAEWQQLAQFILGTHEHTLPKIVISADQQLHAGVFGLVNTTIVIPETMDRAFDPSDREAFLRHELQHVIKKDNLWLFIQKCIRDLLWFHPLAYWLDRQISSEREMMRDEEVLQTTKNITSYINCLMKASKIELPTSYATSVGLKGSPFARRVKAIAGYKSNVIKKVISGLASVCAVAAMAALFVVSTNPVQANDDEDSSESLSVRQLLHKHLELQEEMHKVKSEFDKTAEAYEHTQARLRRALLSDDFNEDLSPDEAAMADRFLARLEEHMEKQSRRDEDREREGDFDETHDGDGIPREKMQMMERQLEEINRALDYLSEQAEDRELNEDERGQLHELKIAKEHLHKTLDQYRDHDDEEGDRDI